MYAKQPFEYKNKQEFKAKLVEWIGDVFYDMLPEHDYEVRDEQIFTAFQIAEALCDQKVHLAEAGLGTGKTFAYLLSAIAYARFTKKPVVIACATTALQEQLASNVGDIATLSKLLGLEVDAQMAKDPHEYICDVRADEAAQSFGELSEEIGEWLQTTKTGQRSEVPTTPDSEWKKIKWEEYMACDLCASRGYCRLVKARKQYQGAKDLLIVDHATFFHDLWTRQERTENGQLTILPDYAAVVFDEGHKILLPAAMQAGKRMHKEEMETMANELEDLQDTRESLVETAAQVGEWVEAFFKELETLGLQQEDIERVSIEKSDRMLERSKGLLKTLDQLLLELQIEQELYSEAVSSTRIQSYENQIEKAIWILRQFCLTKEEERIAWVEPKTDSFWVVPRKVDAKLNKALFQKQMPTIFTSATLSHQGDFKYFAKTLGIQKPSTSTIGSPFDLENQVTIELAETSNKLQSLVETLKENGGRALVLTSTLQEVKAIRRALKEVDLPFEILWEDQGDRGYLVQKFKEEETSVLVGANFWEGIDIKGDALTLVIIWDLPLNITDPLLEASRKEAKEQGLDPAHEVDYPQMALRLKQGCGRLIRSEEDRGKIVILEPVKATPWESYVLGALPISIN
jgi:ATP-dependent DNA helicase DinG